MEPVEVEWSFDGLNRFSASCPYCKKDSYYQKGNGIPANEIDSGCHHFVEYDDDVAVFDGEMRR